MADTRRTLTALQTLLANNQSGDISPQDVRDMLVSSAPPYGSLYISTPAETSVAVQGTYLKVAGTSTSTNLKEFTASDNRLTYTGTSSVHVHVVASVSMTSANNNVVLGIRVAKNGDATDADSIASTIRRKVGTGSDVGSTAVHFDSVMTTNDYIEVWIANETNTGNITMVNQYFFAMGMLM